MIKIVCKEIDKSKIIGVAYKEEMPESFEMPKSFNSLPGVIMKEDDWVNDLGLYKSKITNFRNNYFMFELIKCELDLSDSFKKIFNVENRCELFGRPSIKTIFCDLFFVASEIYLKHIDLHSSVDLAYIFLWLNMYSLDKIEVKTADEMPLLPLTSPLHQFTQKEFNPALELMGCYINEKGKKIIYICEENIIKTAKDVDINVNLLREIVLAHELGHCVFDQEDILRTTYFFANEKEKQAYLFASLIFNGYFDYIIKKLSDKQGGDYKDPILFSDICRTGSYKDFLELFGGIFR